jgi:hypothetical protein
VRPPHPTGGVMSPNFGDGLRFQAATVQDRADTELAATSIPFRRLIEFCICSDRRRDRPA